MSVGVDSRSQSDGKKCFLKSTWTKWLKKVSTAKTSWISGNPVLYCSKAAQRADMEPEDPIH